MLVLARRPGESIRLTLEDGTEIFVTFLGWRGRDAIRLGLSAPPAVEILRNELVERKENGRAVT